MPSFKEACARRAKAVALILCALAFALTSVITASAQAAAHRGHPARVHATTRSHRTRKVHRRHKRRHAKKVKKVTHHKNRTVRPPVTPAPTTPAATTPTPAVASTPTTPQTLTSIGATSGAVTSTDPSGEPMPTGNLPGWTQVFADDFTTSVPLGGFSGCNYSTNMSKSKCTGLPASVSSQLTAYGDGWSDTSGNGRYEASQVLSIHNDMLDYYIHTSGGTHMVAAVVPKIPDGVNGGGLKYGAYAIRFKSDSLPGYKTAFMLWPDSGIWPQDGEIDFPEGDLDSSMDAYMHYMGASSGSQQAAFSTNTSYTSWHTAVIDWTPTQVQFILDGHVIGSVTSLVPSTPMHWVLQAETALSGGTSSSVSGHLYVAWITAYAQS